ncbi:unnamed protein product [Linum tenue]|uniref:Thaumatin-like protein n=1 Tax=Linum tenue TaxID=586396 RepID=A0AAV0JCV1_9ROSI|nr:unnamed protein product [Linum tenue]
MEYVHFIIFLTPRCAGAQSTTVFLTNKCAYTVWPATLTGGGFELPSGDTSSLQVPPNWTSGRIWGRTGCTTNSTTTKFTCLTGDCATGQIECNGAGGIPPATLIELTLNGSGNGIDFYDVSLVDGFNLPVSVEPRGDHGCNATRCAGDVNGVCLPELSVTSGDGRVEPKYCCSGEFNTPEKCPPTGYSKLFKAQCPQAYSYAYDDGSSTFTCPTGDNYLVVFCP